MISLNIDIPVFVIQIVSFCLILFAMRRLVFDPVSQVLAERERRTKGVQHEAVELQQYAATASVEYDRRMQEVRRAIAADTDTERARTSEQEHAIVSAAHDEAAAKLNADREAVRAQADSARVATAGRSQELAELMLERVAGRKFA